MTRRETAARVIGQFLTSDAIGSLLDELGTGGAVLRDQILKAASTARDLAADEAVAESERQRLHAQAPKHVAPPPGGRR